MRDATSSRSGASRRRRSGSLLLATTLLVVSIFAATTRHPALVVAYGLVMLVLLLTNVRELQRLTPRQRSAVILVALTMTVMLPIATVRNEVALAHYLVGMSALAAAIVLTRDPKIYLIASRNCLLVAQTTLLAYLWNSGLSELPLENLLEHTSSNGITAGLVLLQINYSTMKYLMERRSSLFTASVTLVICVIGYGRGSILGSTGVVVVNLISLLSWRSAWRTMAGFAACVAAALVIYVTHGDALMEFVEINTKIGAGLEDEPRQRMIAEYLERIDAVTFVTGASYQGSSIETEFFGNPHNSYIRAHHLFGLPYLVAMLVFPLLLIGRSGRTVTAYASGMLLIVLMRAFTEPLLFPTMFDLYYFAVCLAIGEGRPSQLHAYGDQANRPTPMFIKRST